MTTASAMPAGPPSNTITLSEAVVSARDFPIHESKDGSKDPGPAGRARLRPIDRLIPLKPMASAATFPTQGVMKCQQQHGN
jgi:hypothetical protein